MDTRYQAVSILEKGASKKQKEKHAKEIFSEGAVFIDEDIEPIREPTVCVAATSQPFHCDPPTSPRPRKGRRICPLPTSAFNTNSEDNFDWTAATEVAKDALANLTIIKLAREAKENYENKMLMLTNGSETDDSRLPNESSDATRNKHGEHKEEQLQQLNTDELAKPSSSNGVAAKESPVFMSKMCQFEWLLSWMKEALHFHLESCYFCADSAHNMVECEQLPIFKKERIQELRLCSKCLDSTHLEDVCALRDKIICLLCGDYHLSYVYH